MTPTNQSRPPHPPAAQALPSDPSARFLALDYGERRVGVAVSDDLGMYAHPRPAIIGASGAALLERIASVVTEEAITAVVVGVPITMAGGQSAQTAEVREFVSRLRMHLAVPVIESDERLSSTQAASALRGREKKRSGQRDSAAAAVILQSMLDARRGAFRQ